MELVLDNVFFEYAAGGKMSKLNLVYAIACVVGYQLSRVELRILLRLWPESQECHGSTDITLSKFVSTVKEFCSSLGISLGLSESFIKASFLALSSEESAAITPSSLLQAAQDAGESMTVEEAVWLCRVAGSAKHVDVDMLRSVLASREGVSNGDNEAES